MNIEAPVGASLVHGVEASQKYHSSRYSIHYRYVYYKAKGRSVQVPVTVFLWSLRESFAQPTLTSLKHQLQKTTKLKRCFFTTTQGHAKRREREKKKAS